MPTYATVAFENFLQPRTRDSRKKPLPRESGNFTQENGDPRHLYISPAFNATPEQASIPESCSHDLILPSPCIANHKRRGGGNERTEVLELPCGDEADCSSLVDDVGEISVDKNDDAGEEDEKFLDPRSKAVTVGSEVDGNDFSRSQVECLSFVSAQGEFFDAIDEFSSDGSISNIQLYEARIESELHASRLSLLGEIERRKTAEENLILIHSQWERIKNAMFEAGFTFPAPLGSDSMLLDKLFIDQMLEEADIARFVAEAVGRGVARCQAEEAASAIIELKDQEISRLRDKLQYYETVNHEMSQRKLVEVARRQQERKRSRQRWLISFVGLAIATGASFAAYAYIPHASECLCSLKSDNSPDITSVSYSEISQGHGLC